MWCSNWICWLWIVFYLSSSNIHTNIYTNKRKTLNRNIVSCISEKNHAIIHTFTQQYPLTLPYPSVNLSVNTSFYSSILPHTISSFNHSSTYKYIHICRSFYIHKQPNNVQVRFLRSDKILARARTYEFLSFYVSMSMSMYVCICV